MAEDPVRRQAGGLHAPASAGVEPDSKLRSRGGLGLRASSRSPHSSHHGGKTVKTTVARLLAGIFALALMLAVGLSAQNTAQAQGARTFDTGGVNYVCSLSNGCTNSLTVILQEAGSAIDGDISVKNLDVAEETDVNPKSFTGIGTGGKTLTFVQEFTDTNDDGTVDGTDQIRAFNGNRIQFSHTPTSGFAVTKTITVDNVMPTMVTTSPDIPLMVKGGTDVVFSADITDGGAGYTDSEAGTASGIDTKTATPGVLGTGSPTNDNTPVGGVRLVVAGNVVDLSKGNFTQIDGGWTVSKTIGSSSIQNIGANVPWYFETRDRAGNARRSSGSIALVVSNTATDIGTNTVIDKRFIGGLPTAAFTGTKMKVTRGSKSANLTITGFTSAVGTTGGQFTLTIPSEVADFFPDDPATDDVTESTTLLSTDKFALVGSNLLTIRQCELNGLQRIFRSHWREQTEEEQHCRHDEQAIRGPLFEQFFAEGCEEDHPPRSALTSRRNTSSSDGLTIS